jgi:hypothetical protein
VDLPRLDPSRMYESTCCSTPKSRFLLGRYVALRTGKIDLRFLFYPFCTTSIFCDLKSACTTPEHIRVVTELRSNVTIISNDDDAVSSLDELVSYFLVLRCLGDAGRRLDHS